MSESPLPPPMPALPTEQASFSPTHPVEHAEFNVEGCIWDMDGTLVDSIKAVEAAWTSVAVELGKDPEEVIAATHGRRAIDNLKDLKPQLRRLSNAEMEPHVEEFERRILKEADEFGEKVRTRRASDASSRRNSNSSTRRSSNAGSRRGSNTSGPNPLLTGLAGGQFGFSKIASNASSSATGTKPSTPKSDNGANADLDRVNAKLAKFDLDHEDRMGQLEADPFADDDSDDESDFDLNEYTEEEIGCRNKSVRILPGVRRIIDSLPSGRWAVATSSAKIYAHGALARAGIKRPKVTVTADDPRLTAGKPDPAPFLLAAKDLKIPIEKCVVFEDSPSGIKAGVASGARTIAICTSHPVEKINTQGAHYIVPSLDCVHVRKNKDGSLRVIIDAHPPEHPRHGSRGSFVAVPPEWRKMQQERAAAKNAAAAGGESSHLRDEIKPEQEQEAPREEKQEQVKDEAEERAEARA